MCLLNILGKGVNHDTALKSVLGNHLAVNSFLWSFANDVECPVLILLCEDVKGLYQQVELST